MDDPLGPVGVLPDQLGPAAQPAALDQAAQRLLRSRTVAGLAQQPVLRKAAAGVQHQTDQDGCRRVGLEPVGPVLRELVRLQNGAALQPKAAGKHRVNRVVEGAEIAFAYKGGQTEHLLRHDRLPVQRLQHLLEPLPVARFQGEHHTLQDPVPLAEGNGHAHAGPERHPFRDAVAPGLVERIGQAVNGCFRNHAALPDPGISADTPA